MVTVVNTPPTNEGSNSNNGTNSVLIVVLFLIFIILLGYFGLPLLRRATTAPQINVPDKIDVNVNTPQQ